MRVRIKISCGAEYMSDEITVADVANTAGMSEDEVRPELEKIVEMFDEFTEYQNISFTINSTPYTFNTKHIVWLSMSGEI